VPRAQDADKYKAYWTCRIPPGSSDSCRASTIAILMSELWQKLARRDLTLKAVADGFRITNTPGMGAGSGEPKSLSPLIDVQTDRPCGAFVRARSTVRSDDEALLGVARVCRRP